MPMTATYVAIGIVRLGFFASSRKIAVASNPMNAAIANMRPTPGAPETMFAGSNGASERPSGPPDATTATTSASTMRISPTSSTPSTFELNSMWR
jgi:hypothetical protein